MKQIGRSRSSGGILGISRMWILLAILAKNLILVEAKRRKSNSGGGGGGGGGDGSGMPVEAAIAIGIIVPVVVLSVLGYHCYKKCSKKSASTNSVSSSTGGDNAGK